MSADPPLKWDRNLLVDGIHGTIAVGMIFLLGARPVIAGPVPMPVEARIDLARSVVVGQITQITPVDLQLSQGVHYGRATIAVKETLKGANDKTVKVIVATSYDSNYGGAEAAHSNKVGDSGIWLLWPMAEGLLTGRGEDCIGEQRKADVQRMLKELAQRKWSEPVNGLSAWTMVVPLEYSANRVIIFAVKNAANKDLYIPV